MIKLSKRIGVSVFAVLVLLLNTLALPASAKQNLQYREEVIAGGPDKFVTVRHVVLKGSNFDIGQKIGEIAKKDGAVIAPSDNRIMNRAKREYMAQNYPVMYERMKGVAQSFGLDITDDPYDFT